MPDHPQESHGLSRRSLLGGVVAGAAATVAGGALADAASAVPRSQQPSAFPTSRNALTWPFAADSIWNTSIGSGARYAPCNFNPLVIPEHGHSQDDDLLIHTPNAPETPVRRGGRRPTRST